MLLPRRHPEEVARGANGRQKTAEEPPPPMKADDGSPIHSATTTSPHRRRTGAADAPSDISNRPTPIVEKGNGAIRQRRSMWYRESPTPPPWASYMRRTNKAAREMWAPSAWSGECLSQGNSGLFCRTHEQPINEESVGFSDGDSRVAPSTPTRYARMLRVRAANESNPVDMMILRLQKIAGAKETPADEAGRPQQREGMDEYIRSRTDWKERAVLRLACITASRLFEIAFLNPTISKLEPDRALIGIGPWRRRRARADPHRLAVLQDTRAGGVLDVIQLCRTLQETKSAESTSAQVDKLWLLGMPRRIPQTRCAVARGSNRGDIQFGSTRDLAVGDARRPV
ncbi:hypothetical protein TcBrA4_0114970 [Trypanosoma cruzi]|nr:hypothetical protein TcBrA4_0114970 [Trypanosoma cruzi]